VGRRRRPPPAPRRRERGDTWQRFLARHRDAVLAGDCFTVETAFLKTLYALFFLDLVTRRVHFAGCTAHPTAAWVTQQARKLAWALQEADAPLRFLIHDRDAKFPPSCDTILADEGVEVTRTPYQSPTANAYAERWVRSVRAADRDHRMIGGAGHLRRGLAEYVAHSNEARPHQGLDQRCPIPPTARRRERLGGVRHDYDREAA
jgi:putative transposase